MVDINGRLSCWTPIDLKQIGEQAVNRKLWQAM